MTILKLIVCGVILVLAIWGLVSELFYIVDRFDIYKNQKEDGNRKE